MMIPLLLNQWMQRPTYLFVLMRPRRMNPRSKLASSLFFGKRRGKRHTKLSITCFPYSYVTMYLAYLNYISYSWVAVLIVGVVAADFQNSRCLTQPVLFYWPFSTKSGFKPRHPHYLLLRHRPPEGHRREGLALEARGQSEPWPGLHHSHHHIDPQRDTVGCL